jgi:hypothetical protein
MPRRATVDTAALDALLRPGRSVATHRELTALGLPASTVTHRCRPDGPWQRMLPGVIVAHRGTPTTFERRLAALAYAGEGAALTGLDALAEMGMAVRAWADDDRVHVLVPHGRQRQSHAFAVVTRTRRPPEVMIRRGLPCVAPARAVIDACRRLRDLGSVRGLVAEAVQQRRCTPEDLLAELRLAPRQRTAAARVVLREVRAGVRSGAEAALRRAFTRLDVPPPVWNATVREADGERIAVVDACWAEQRVIVEVDSMEWHLGPEAYLATQRRQRRLVLAGWTVLPVAPQDVLRDPEQVCREVLAALSASSVARVTASA